MKKLFSVLSLAFLLTINPSHSASAFSELPEAKCNKKCQEEKKANKKTCSAFTEVNTKLTNTIRARNENRITREFQKNELINLTSFIYNQTSNKTRDDLEVYMKEFGYWTFHINF